VTSCASAAGSESGALPAGLHVALCRWDCGSGGSSLRWRSSPSSLSVSRSSVASDLPSADAGRWRRTQGCGGGGRARFAVSVRRYARWAIIAGSSRVVPTVSGAGCHLIGAANPALPRCRPLRTATKVAVRGRVKFHAPAADANIDWDAAAGTAGALLNI
jgi:hypothetical protein